MREVIVKGKDPNVEAVVKRMRERSAEAIAQYRADTTRQDYSTADWLAEIRDEAMDTAVYAEAALRSLRASGERPAPAPANLPEICPYCRHKFGEPHPSAWECYCGPCNWTQRKVDEAVAAATARADRAERHLKGALEKCGSYMNRLTAETERADRAEEVLRDVQLGCETMLRSGSGLVYRGWFENYSRFMAAALRSSASPAAATEEEK